MGVPEEEYVKYLNQEILSRRQSAQPPAENPSEQLHAIKEQIEQQTPKEPTDIPSSDDVVVEPTVEPEVVTETQIVDTPIPEDDLPF